MHQQEIEDNADGFNADLGFRVDFVEFPPVLSIIKPDGYISDNSCDEHFNESEATYRGVYRRIVVNEKHHGGAFIEIRVPIGGNRCETLMCMGDVEKPNYAGSTPANRPGKVAEALQRGKAAGGHPRRMCTGPRGPLEGTLEAEYDEVDELLRRLKIASAQTSKSLDEELISYIVKQYLEDIHDSTLGRYS